MIIPTGKPVWERANDHTSYGGNVEKQNHLGQGAIDSLTDVAAEEFSRMVADLAAVARTAPFLVLTYECNDASPAAPTIVTASGMLGQRTASYEGDAAPTGFPSAVRNGDGDVTFTFSSSYLDEFGIAGSFQLSHPRANLVFGAGSAPCEIVTATTVRVRAYTSGLSAFADAKVTLVVHSGS